MWGSYLSWGRCTCNKSYSTPPSKQTVLVLLDSPSLPGLLRQARSCPASVILSKPPQLVSEQLVHSANTYLLGLNCVAGPGLGTGLLIFTYVFYKGSYVAMGHTPKSVCNVM